jgi:hypothetical protein
MVKLIIQKNKTVTATIKSSVCSVRVLDLFLWNLVLVLALGILAFVWKGASPLVGQLGWRWLEHFLGFFSHSPWFYGPSIASRSSEVVSPGSWLVSSIWFLLSMGKLQLGLKVTHC